MVKEYPIGVVQKDGFISKKELHKVAHANHISKNTLVRKLNTAVDSGYIQKTVYGYTLTSFKTINKSLQLNTVKKYENGVQSIRTPFMKVTGIDSVRKLELISLYLLMKQINSRYQFIKNGRSDRYKKEVPEMFELSIETILRKGNYKSKSGKYASKATVHKMIAQLEAIGLLTVVRGTRPSPTEDYTCNKYRLHNLNKVCWSKLNDIQLSYKEQMRMLCSTPKKKKVVKKKKTVIKRTKTVHTSVEKKFLEFLSAGGQNILCENGILNSKTYHTFGSQAGKKVSRTMFPNLLVECLNDVQLRKILMVFLSPSDINVFKGEGSWRNTHPNCKVYDRDTLFNYDLVELTDNGDGNFEEYEDVYLQSKKMKQRELVLSYYKGLASV